MKTSLKAGFAKIFSCCPKNLSCPKFWGAAASLAPPPSPPPPPARVPMIKKGGGFEESTDLVDSSDLSYNLLFNGLSWLPVVDYG